MDGTRHWLLLSDPLQLIIWATLLGIKRLFAMGSLRMWKLYTDFRDLWTIPRNASPQKSSAQWCCHAYMRWDIAFETLRIKPVSHSDRNELFSNTQDSESWMKHAKGLSRLAGFRGLDCYRNEFDSILLKASRGIIVCTSNAVNPIWLAWHLDRSWIRYFPAKNVSWHQRDGILWWRSTVIHSYQQV